MNKFKNGFSLIELLITLAIITALVAVVTPLALNAIRSAKATKASANLKSISNSIYNYFYVENELPTDVNELVRDLNEETYGVAYKENEDGTYEYIAFTSDNADLLTMHELLPNVSSSIPENEEEYNFLSNGRDTFENLVAKYVVNMGKNGIIEPSSSFNIANFSYGYDAFVSQEKSENGFVYSDTGIIPNGTGNQASIFKGNESATDYTINVTASYSGDGDGYGIYFRTVGVYNEMKGYIFQIDEGLKRFVIKTTDGRPWNQPETFNGLKFSDAGLKDEKLPQGSHNISITVSGNRMTATFNGVTVIDITDDTYTNGWVGIRRWNNTEVVFDSFSVN